MTEEWVNIPNYDGLYMASSLGRIKSFKNKKERVLKPRKNRRYLNVALCKDGLCKTFTVHRLIALSFLGKSDLTVNHKDNNKLNNAVSNLEWVTKENNYKYAVRDGLIKRGQENGYCKLKDTDVVAIRERHKKGERFATLGRLFRVTRHNIRSVVLRETWRHLP